MSNITNRLNTVVSKAETDADIFHDVVHGDKTKVVTTDGGNVDSVAKRLSEIPAGQDGLGQYIRYKLENDGTTPTRSSIPTPPIGSDGVLGTVTGWSDTLLAPAANRTLWVAIGHGRASEAVVWSGAYPIQKGETGKQGERGLTGVGTPGLDGLGQYILYANVSDGTTPDHTAADTPTIGADGVLPVITDWTVTIPSPVADTKLWGLVGYGTAGNAVTWVSVFQAGLKGEKGETGDDGTNGLDGTNGKSGLNQYILYRLEDKGNTPAEITDDYTITANGELPAITGWSKSVLSMSANKVLWMLIGRGRIGEIVVWSGFYPIRKGDKGKQGNIGNSGLGQYILYANVDDGTTPDHTVAATPTIGADGILPYVTDWRGTIPNPAANKSLWGLVGYGIAGNAVTWVSVFQARLKGEKGDKGDGIGYYVYFKYCEEGSPCRKPDEGRINAKGVLTIYSDWEKTPEEAAGVLATSLGQVVDGYVVPDNYVLWFLLGAGKVSDKVRWVSIFPTRGQKGERGDPAVGALGDSAVRTSKIADGAVTKPKLGVDVVTVARADAYEEYVKGKVDYNNTFLSAENGQANTTGYSNTASGTRALYNNTTGHSNTASGYGALYNNTTGHSNTASGYGALYNNTTGHNNTASGDSALVLNTTGDYNTASGTGALLTNTTGDSNIGIGNVRTPSATSNGYLNIGRVLTGNLSTGNLTLTGILTQYSDERLKENIADVQDGLDCVKKLRPVKYTRKEIPDPVFPKDKDGNDIIPDPAPQGGQRGSSEVEHGLIAQEVEKVCPDLVGTSEYSEGYKSVDYSRLSVVLLKAVQEQQETIEALQKRIVALEA